MTNGIYLGSSHLLQVKFLAETKYINIPKSV